MANGAKCFCGILYPDSESYDVEEVLAIIRDYFDQWAYVLHDKDILPESGEQKLAHIHWVGKFQNARQLSTISKRLGVEENFIEYVRTVNGRQNWRGAVRYLVHASDKDKYQYPVSDVVSNFDIQRFTSNLDQSSQVQLLVGFIDEHPQCNWRHLFDFAIANGCYSELLRAKSLLLEIMKLKRGKDSI